jgi:hypothetical protein
MYKRILPIFGASGALGFYRGTQEYKYNYNKDLKRYNEHLEEYNKKVEENKKNKYTYTYDFHYTKPYFFYVDNFMNGLCGTFFYMNPVFFPFLFFKEMYRLEVNMRNELNELKNQDKYYRLL